MLVAPEAKAGPPRRPAWRWWVCGLLLLATMLNYMDRLTLNLTAVRIMDDFHLNEADYAQLESAFAFAFALGALAFGWMADRWNVYWIYPAAVLAWSAAGFATGLAPGFLSLLLCRGLLGLAESGNWPCALRTTQRLLPPGERAMGNGLLQSGAAVGAFVTPLIVLVLVRLTDTWRYPFLAVGVLGVSWAFLWLFVVRRQDLAIPRGPSPALAGVLAWLVLLLGSDVAVHLVRSHPAWSADFASRWLGTDAARRMVALLQGRFVPLAVKAVVCVLGIAGVFAWLRGATRGDTYLPRGLFFRRFWALVVVAIVINTTWHFFRAWLPLFLQKQHHYSEAATYWFILAYYVATDAGALSAGFAAMTLARRGLSVHRSRLVVYLACTLLTALSLVAANLPAGPALLGVLLVIGFGSLGLFPNYYSFTQELTVRHQGKLTGAFGCMNWLAMYLLHEAVGTSIQQTGSYQQGVALAGLAPLLGLAALVALWGKAWPAAAADQ